MNSHNHYSELALEDEYEDILGKAIRGLNLPITEVANNSGVDVNNIKKALKGEVIESDIPALAKALGLRPQPLIDTALKKWRPASISKIDGFEMDSTPWKSMVVNSYLVWDPISQKAAFFDTGASAENLIRFTKERDLQVESIFVTHTHGDHIADLERVMNETTASKIWASELEPVPGADLFQPGQKWELGNLTIESRLTCGHSAGGITYVVRGLSHLIAIVGDAVFAGSMGGGMISYSEAKNTAQSQIMTLDPKTVLAPGHGPLTTVEEESHHNPFLATES
jgi:hydroxyacylglutathione hydrolase